MSHRRDSKGEPLVDPSENLPAGVHPAHPGGFSSLAPTGGNLQLLPVLLAGHTRSPTVQQPLRGASASVSQLCAEPDREGFIFRAGPCA